MILPVYLLRLVLVLFPCVTTMLPRSPDQTIDGQRVETCQHSMIGSLVSPWRYQDGCWWQLALLLVCEVSRLERLEDYLDGGVDRWGHSDDE